MTQYKTKQHNMNSMLFHIIMSYNSKPCIYQFVPFCC